MIEQKEGATMYETMPQNHEDGQEISLMQLFEIAKRRRGLIALCTLAVLLCAFVYVMFKGVSFESSSTVVVEPIANSISIFSNDGGTLSADVSMEIQLLKSDKVMQDALSMLDLSSYKDSKGVPYSQKPAKVWELDNVAKKISISNPDKSKVMKVTVKDSNPSFCADFANALVSAFADLLSRTAKSTKTQLLEFVEKQIPETTAMLEASFDALTKYKEENETIKMSDRVSLLSNRIVAFDVMMEPLEMQLVESEALMNSLSSLVDGLPSVDAIMANEVVSSLLNEYRAVATEFYRYKGSTSIADESRIATLENSLGTKERELAVQIVSISGMTGISSYTKAVIDYLGAKIRLSVLKTLEAQYNEELAKYPSIERKLTELQADVSIYKSLQSSLKTTYERTKIEEASISSNIEIVDYAAVPSQALPRKRLMTLAVAFVLGFGGGCLLAFVLELTDSHIKDEDVIRSCIGRSPRPLGWTLYSLARRKAKKGRTCLEMVEDPESCFAERYKAIANNLISVLDGSPEANDLHGGAGTVVAFGSVDEHEGASQVLCNVGVYYASIGRKTLVVDVDGRSCSMESLFGIKKPALGVSDVVNEGVPLEMCIVKPLKGLSKLHFLSCGKAKFDPNAIYSAKEFHSMMGKLSKVYDFILVNAPAFAYASEVQSLSSSVDGIVFVARAGFGTKGSLYGFAQEIPFLDASVIGYVYHGVVPANQGRYGANCKYEVSGNVGTVYEVGKGSYKSINRSQIKCHRSVGVYSAELAFARDKVKGVEG